MTSSFVLHPFDHSGASFPRLAHAHTRHSLGGKQRQFVLRLHGNTLYFKEPSRTSIYAVFGEFDSVLANDPDALVATWKKEVERDNFGAFGVRRDYFPGLAVRGQLLFVVQSQGRLWVKEHFDSQWFKLPSHALTFGVFDPRGARYIVSHLLIKVQSLLLDRALEPEILTLDRPRFVGPDANHFEQLARALSCFSFLPFFARHPLTFKSHSTFSEGEQQQEILRLFLKDDLLLRIWDLLLESNTFVGVHWSEGREERVDWSRQCEEGQRYLAGESRRTVERGIQKWGRNWRGNWAPQGARAEIRFSEEASAHERLEAVLLLREWMQDRLALADQKMILARIFN